MANEETPKTPEVKTPDINDIVKTAVESAMNSFKTELNEAYQTKIAEAVKASQATIIKPTAIEPAQPNATLDFVKQTLQQNEDNRSLYGKFKTHRDDDLAKNKILTLKAAYPELTPEQIHAYLFED